jgi:hypothetical protein
MKKDVKSGLAEVALEQLNIAFNPSIEQTQTQIEATADASDQVKLDPSTVEQDRQTLYLHEYKITQSDNCCYAVLHYLSNYDLPDEALHDLIVWRSHDYANILIDLADGLFNVFGSSFEHFKTTAWEVTAPHGKRVDDLLFHTVEIID